MSESSKLQLKLEELRGIESETLNAKQHLSTLEAKASVVRQELERLAKRGESSGDEILDHLLRQGVGLNEREYQRLAAINSALAGKKGELVAVFYTEMVLIRSGSDPVFELKQRVTFCVLTDDHLAFDRKYRSAVLPTQKYSVRNSRGDVDIVQCPLSEGTSHFGRFELYQEGVPMEHSPGYLLVGTEATRAYVNAPYFSQLKGLVGSPWGDVDDTEKLFQDLGYFELVQEPAVE